MRLKEPEPRREHCLYWKRNSNEWLERGAIGILLACVLVSPVYLLLVTPDAVVIGTDSKSTNVSNVLDGSSAIRFGETEKVVSIANGKVLIGTIGLAKIEHNYRVREVIYDFPVWARALNIKPDTPIMQVARVVANDSFRVMNKELPQRLRDGRYSPEKTGQNLNRLVGYYIGKCDPGGCAAVTIQITIDWEKRILNQPKIQVVASIPNSQFNFSTSSSAGGVIDRFLPGNLPTKQLYLQKYPKEIAPLFRTEVLRPEEMVNLTKLLLSLEIDEHSDLYSFPVVIYSLTAHGNATRHEYEQ